MLKISYAGCLGLSSAISAQFILEMHVAAQNRKKNSLKPILWVKGHSRSSMLTFLRSSSAVPLFLPLVCGDPLHPAAWNFATKY